MWSSAEYASMWRLSGMSQTHDDRPSNDPKQTSPTHSSGNAALARVQYFISLKAEHGPQGEPVERRLAAILAADVVGYSRLMERDKAGTLATLKPLRPQAQHNHR